jgi:hypothetical protein
MKDKVSNLSATVYKSKFKSSKSGKVKSSIGILFLFILVALI